MRLAISNAHAINDDRSHLAVKHLIRTRDLFFQSGGECHHLESGARLVNVAHRPVFERFVLNFLANVGIESGAVRQRQDFAGVRIFHDHRTSDSMALFHAALQFTLGNVLNVLINSEHDAIARLRFLFNAGKPALARVDGNHQLTRLALQLLIELPLQSAQSLIVGAHIAKNLCRQFTLGIKPLRFFLKVNALQVQRPNTLDGFGVGLSRHPTKCLVPAAVGEHNPWILFRYARDQAYGISEVGSFRRHHES